jgi:hypothetical protein
LPVIFKGTPLKKIIALSVVLLATTLLSLPINTGRAQQNPPRGGAARGTGIEPLALDDHTGFTDIFDGQTLKGWDGDPNFWRVADGAIVGESTAEKPLKTNTFLIWRIAQPKDFELKLEYRINSTNSGVQYRSAELTDVGKWVLKGYQADIDFQNTYTGQLYEERGRGFLALRGQMTHLQPGKKQLIANVHNGEELKGLIKSNDWNQLHIIARGNRLTHILNGHLMAEVIDDDAEKRALGGLLGFQMHVGPPMKVEFRNIRLKNL